MDLHYNAVNSCSFNGVKIYEFSSKDFGINSYPVCLGNILQDFLTDNVEKTELYEYVCNFSINYGSTDVDNIFGIYKYIMNTV